MNNTKILMTASAVIMGIAGLLLIFLPQEILGYSGMVPVAHAALVLQVLGALYFSFAVLNWMTRSNLIGGIYGKPVAMGNFAHFFISGLTIIKAAFVLQTAALWTAGLVYAVFALLFALVTFGNPIVNAEKA